MRVSVVAIVTVDKLDVGDRTAVIVENEPLMAELVVGALPGVNKADDEPAVIVEKEPLIVELVTDTGLDAAVFPEDNTADDEPVVDPDEGGGPVPARMRTPTLIVLAALLMAFCADRK